MPPRNSTPVFIPMVANGSMRGEVQRPQATVVIGGIVSKTLLTLVVLPVLYSRVGQSLRKETPMIL